MKNYTNSDYALNKYSEGIVYRFADGIVEVTLADYLAENPHKTEADFLALKELSDSIYLHQVKAENAQTKKNAPFDELEETALFYSPSPEDSYIGEIDAQEEAEKRARQLKTAHRALDTLTAVQRRRYLLHRVDGLTVREIAEIEGTHFTSVNESLAVAEKKIMQFLANG